MEKIDSAHHKVRGTATLPQHGSRALDHGRDEFA